MTDYCSHVWINPKDAPGERRPYAPIVGPARWHMKPGETYHCTQCGERLTIRPNDPRPSETDAKLS